jgi:hypothetical protein
MKCPNCKEDMKIGFVQASRSIIRTPRKHKISLNLRDDGQDIVPDRNYRTTPKVESFYCPRCSFTVTPVSNGGRQE